MEKYTKKIIERMLDETKNYGNFTEKEITIDSNFAKRWNHFFGTMMDVKEMREVCDRLWK